MPCSDCRYWVPTHMEVHRPDAQPHEARSIAMETEMLRATHALCVWPTQSRSGAAFIPSAPEWLQKRVGGGNLTSEDEGVGCSGWVQREYISLNRDAR